MIKTVAVIVYLLTMYLTDLINYITYLCIFFQQALSASFLTNSAIIIVTISKERSAINKQMINTTYE